MGTLCIVEDEVARQLLFCFADALVGMEIHLFILHTAPQPLDEDVVEPAALAVHADANAVGLQNAGELEAGELAALVGIEDFRPAILGDGLLERLDAKIRAHADRHAVRQYLAGRPVNNGNQIDETPTHRDVGDVGRPALIGTVDSEPPEQVRIDRVRRMGRAGIAPAIKGMDAHLGHQRAHMLSADTMAFQPEHVAKHATAGKGEVQMQLVHASHERQIGLGGLLRR